ncbi:DUF1398 domain-containing protein [Chitinophaga sancti]|uniref:DUF1398 family protein n=1 Tax=Chitinophaga sancti TaxID=1004 RepID=A0A1K1SEV3_9BACT|nr:DUF1398 family protein [Chitinophaga sancti]WQD59947.1 DUF1398 family protein [Chitinophaga sancti]WQG87923.1 DUF1398 family protein [Chitinophaga sancti]SFW82445.1 Uncharacterized conserved protein YbcV, DUF1398 family [Chitinophaga sancti]
MVTIQEIKNAHAKVRSGVDFPQYIRDLKGLGIVRYETYVSDGHTEYWTENGETVISEEKYDFLEVEKMSNVEGFRRGLREHQEGKSDYMGFCRMCAENGVKKWVVSMGEMTCVYFDVSGVMMVEERIPE